MYNEINIYIAVNFNLYLIFIAISLIILSILVQWALTKSKIEILNQLVYLFLRLLFEFPTAHTYDTDTENNI